MPPLLPPGLAAALAYGAFASCSVFFFSAPTLPTSASVFFSVALTTPTSAVVFCDSALTLPTSARSFSVLARTCSTSAVVFSVCAPLSCASYSPSIACVCACITSAFGLFLSAWRRRLSAPSISTAEPPSECSAAGSAESMSMIPAVKSSCTSVVDASGAVSSTSSSPSTASS